MQPHFDAVAARSGRALPGISVAVTLKASGAPAVIYTDNGTTTQANPMTTDVRGRYGFYAADGAYQLTFSGPGFMTVTEDLLLEDPTVLTARLPWLVHPSTQLTNSFLEMVVPLNGTTYVDNVLTIQNKSVGEAGATGNAAIRFRDSVTGYERGAIGYSRVGTGTVTGYYPNTLYCEIGNLSADADDTLFRVIATFLAGSATYPAGYVYFPFEINPTTGAISLKTPVGSQATIALDGNIRIGTSDAPKTLDIAGNSTVLRVRERGADDRFAITANIDTGTVQDNPALPSWQVKLGGGSGDDFTVSRSPAGSGTFVDLLRLTASQVVLSQNVAVGAVGSVKQVSAGMSTTLARFRERVQDDMLGISTNINSAGVQDNVAKSSWQVLFGYGAGEDMFKVSRSAPGSGTMADLFRINNAGVAHSISKAKVSTDALTTITLTTQRTYLTGTAGASLAVTLPAGSAAIDGAIYTVMSTAARAATTWVSTGATFVGTPSSLSANTPVSVQYHHATTEWFVTA